VTEKNNGGKNFKYHMALAILRKLWSQGLITEEELKRIDLRNSQKYLKKAQ